MNGPAELDAVVRMVLLETVLLLPLDALVAEVGPVDEFAKAT
jgi:hypothetical protein